MMKHLSQWLAAIIIAAVALWGPRFTEKRRTRYSIEEMSNVTPKGGDTILLPTKRLK